MPLTAKNFRKNYSLRDMEGLHLFVSAKGAKSWHFRFNWLGKPARPGTSPSACLPGSVSERIKASLNLCLKTTALSGGTLFNEPTFAPQSGLMSRGNLGFRPAAVD